MYHCELTSPRYFYKQSKFFITGTVYAVHMCVLSTDIRQGMSNVRVQQTRIVLKLLYSNYIANKTVNSTNNLPSL